MIIHDLLLSVSDTRNKYEKEIQLSGKKFNPFILMGNRFERKHTRVLYELLNPKGTHYHRNVFINEFIRTVFPKDKHKFGSIENWIVKEEFASTNRLDGRLDLLLENDNHVIGIENKIDAGDQPNQLWRHNQYLVGRGEHTLFYLTIDGRKAGVDSLKSANENIQDLNSDDYICISYNNHIKQWLERCISRISPDSELNNSINYYLESINHLIGAGLDMAENKEIIDLMTGNFESFKSSWNISMLLEEAKNSMREECARFIFPKLEKLATEKG